jgi:hypothetical protein
VASQHANEQRRKAALEHARKLARSGRFRDHGEIRSALTDVATSSVIKDWLEDRRFCRQLDLLCCHAQFTPKKEHTDQ